MAQVINTNVASLNAQRNLQNSQNSLQVSLQRLSSGLRINSAKDDAAGLAIGERFTSQIRGLNQAARNANDGISMSQTAEGALVEVTNNLQRVRELAVQSANASNSSGDRAALDAEVQQRLAEVDRIASQTAFNGQKVLDGTMGNATFQVGANVGETINVALSTSMRTTAIGKTADYVNSTIQYDPTKALGAQGTGVSSSPLASGELTIAVGTGSGVSVGVSSDLSSSGAGRTADSAYSKLQSINAAGIGGLTATADTTVSFTFADTTALNTAYTLSINTKPIYTAYDSSGPGGVLTGDKVAAAINANASVTGVTANYDSTTTRLTLNAVDGRNISLSQTNTGAANQGLAALSGNNNTVNNTTGPMTTGAGATVALDYRGTIRLTAADSITIGGTVSTDAGFANASMALGPSALNSASVTTVANANTAITRVDAAITAVNTLRGTLGAVQNRFDSAIASMQTTVENLSSSRSRIQDADFASETAALTRNQILQQAGIAMLGQSNQLPQQVLSLLRG